MESLLQSIEVTGQIELVKIIQELLIRFGNDATELVTQMLEKGTAIEAVKINTLSSVKTATGSSVKIATGSSVKTAPPPSTINHAALCKIEKKEKSKKDFDMSRYRQRHIAIQIQYEGEPYYGFTTQTGGCEETVEKHIFEALLKLRLITDRHNCQYSRCGRTDRGVSALGQTIALKVRSAIPISVAAEDMPKHPTDSIIVKTRKTTTELNKKSNSKNIQNNNKQTKCSDDVSREEIEVVGKKRKSSEELVDKTEECRNFRGEKDKKIEVVGEAIVVDEDKKILNYIEEEEEYKEMDYCLMLNRVLPDSIRAMGWNEVTPEFSSRFSCAYRKYRYFFIKRNLDIEKMSEATNRLIGDHDFRNICKIDIAKVSNFEREIYSANIVPFQIDMIHPELSVYMLEIQGIAFLWHMVRCIMSLLFMIGEGYEDLNIIDILLDIEVTPAKPHYKMAPDLPLVLHECGFDNMKMHYQPSVLWTLTSHYEELWSKHMIACARAKNALESLKSWEVRKDDVENFITYITDKKKSINDRKSGYKKNDKEKQNSDKSADKDFMLLEADQSSDLIQNTGNKNENDGGILIVCEKSNTDIDFNDMESANMELEEHSLISSLENQNMIWSEVLILLASKYDLLPTKDLLPHVPLTQRHTNDTYMDRRNQLTGNKKERLDRHLHLKEANVESDPNFFAKMRGQGAV